MPRDMKSPECRAVDALPAHIKARYRRLALVTRAEHIAVLDPGDEETLIVCCDWLLWQESIAAGRHCVHYELGIAEWDKPNRLDSELYIRANDWIYDEGQDITLFHGVSLGKLFCTDVAMATMNYHRLERSLDGLVRKFRARKILYFDFANDINVLDYDLRRIMADAAARAQGLEFEDRGAAAIGGGQSMSENPLALGGHGPVARALLFAYTRGVEMLTNLRCLFKDRGNRVLVVAVGNVVEPLVRTFAGGRLTPIFMARAVPKRFGVLLKCLRDGVLLATPKSAALTAEDERRLRAIESDLERAFAKRANGPTEFERLFARRQILGAGRLAAMAVHVRESERLLDRYRPRRIVVDGERNPPVRTYMELARVRGIDVDYMWHSPLVPQHLKFDALGGDPRAAPTVSRCLSWGSVNDAWLDAVGAKQPRVRAGCPLSDRYSDRKSVAAGGRNVLFLQYAPIVSDLRGLNATIYQQFVDVVRMLAERGYNNVRFKLHPGPGRFKKDYFERIARHFDIHCQVFKTEPFDECVAWADIVIGPVQTGAMLEALAAGKPYHAMLVPPHSMDTSYYGDYPILASVDELARALDRPPTSEAANNLLNAFYSVDEYPSGSRRFWEVMDSDAEDRHAAVAARA